MKPDTRKVNSCMKRDVFIVLPTTTMQQATRLIAVEHIGTLPVVDEESRLIGIVRLQDLLKVFMPDFFSLLKEIDFIHDFGALERIKPDDVPKAANLTMHDLMVKPVSLREDAGLMHALATILKHELQDLPIVDHEGVLVGIASRVDIVAAFFSEAE